MNSLDIMNGSNAGIYTFMVWTCYCFGFLSVCFQSVSKFDFTRHWLRPWQQFFAPLPQLTLSTLIQPLMSLSLCFCFYTGTCAQSSTYHRKMNGLKHWELKKNSGENYRDSQNNITNLGVYKIRSKILFTILFL